MPLDPLATAADVVALLGRSLTTAEETRYEFLLAASSARVRTYTGQEFTSRSTSDRLQVRRGRVRLPQRPVTAVSAVEDVNNNAILYTWDAGEWLILGNELNLFDREPWSSGIRWVDVTYTHGYASIPADVVQVVLQMSARAFAVPADKTGYGAENIDGYSYSLGGAAAAGAVGMLNDEVAALDVYRRMGSSIPTPQVWL